MGLTPSHSTRHSSGYAGCWTSLSNDGTEGCNGYGIVFSRLNESLALSTTPTAIVPREHIYAAMTSITTAYPSSTTGKLIGVH